MDKTIHLPLYLLLLLSNCAQSNFNRYQKPSQALNMSVCKIDKQLNMQCKRLTHPYLIFTVHAMYVFVLLLLT